VVGFRVVLGVGAPLAAIVVWGLFAAPRARIKVPLPVVLVVKAVVFGAAVVALWAVGQHGLAIAFAIIAFGNTALATADRNALMNARR
jgi:hypothetical protein